MKSILGNLCFALTVVSLGACGGGSGASPVMAPPSGLPDPTPPPVPTTPVTVEPDFSVVAAEIQRHPIADMGFIIGDADGVVFTIEKGAFSVDQPLRIASASKLLTGLAVWSLVERGVISESTTPIGRIPDWPTDSPVTVGQLLSFTSGYNARPRDSTCAGKISISLRDCVGEIAAQGPQTSPGEAFAYGPNHMQIAAQLVKSVTGDDLSEVLRTHILDPVGASDRTGFFRGDNVRYSGNAVATASDYGAVLQGVLSGQLVSDLDGFLRDRPGTAAPVYRPSDFESQGRDWHYGFGFWIQCDSVPFADACAQTPTVSSNGARGFAPWIDFKTGYWALIAMETELGTSGDDNASSTELQQILQPMIAEALSP